MRHDLTQPIALVFIRDSIRRGWVPTLTQSVFAWIHQPAISPLPCSSSRGEDAVVLRSFFTRRDGSLLPARGGAVFLEMGAADGFTESNSWFFERCLGWRGILVEAQPYNFEQLLRYRHAALSIRLAVCRNFGVLSFTTDGGTAAKRIQNRQDGGLKDTAKEAAVACGPLGPVLSSLGVHRLDYFSLE